MTDDKNCVGIFWVMHQSALLSGGPGYDELGYPPRADALFFKPHPKAEHLEIWVADERVRDLVRLKYHEAQGEWGFTENREHYVRLNALPEDLREQVRTVLSERMLEARRQTDAKEMAHVSKEDRIFKTHPGSVEIDFTWDLPSRMSEPDCPVPRPRSK